MKKLLCIILTAALLIAGVCGIGTSAYFGTGVQVMVKDASLIKSGLKGQKMCFSDTDFKTAFGITDFSKITVTSLPSSIEGTLLLAGRRVSEGQSIKRKNIAAMVFVPASQEVEAASFRFTIEGALGGEETVCQMKFIDKINYAPEAQKDGQAGVTATTQSNISCYGRLDATDPEGDELEFIIVSYPKNGTISLTDKSVGSYKYTPYSEFTGYDKFVYVARDSYGNYSEAVTVGIRVVERMSSQVFVDMTDRSEYNAAVAMSAMGIMTGNTLGDDSYFLPDETVSRAEFVAMAMKAQGIRADSTVSKSFFDDNGDIPSSLMGYVATAQRLGIIDGEFTDGKLLFKPNEEISKYEAATILARLKGVNTEDEETVFAEMDSIPVWARGSVSAMITLGIFDTSDRDASLFDSVTRADAAEYLYRSTK